MADKPSLLVLGGTGMLGHRLAGGLIERGYDVTLGVRRRPNAASAAATMPAFAGAARLVEGFDAYDYRATCDKVADIGADVVINCIGVIKQRGEGKDSVACIAINALLPHALEEAVARSGGRLIHFSTDCVFKGDRGGYRESDAPDAEDWYGRTKAMGEVTGPHALTLRTSIIGPEIATFSSLVEWFIAHAGKPVSGFDRAIYSGVTTREMVNVIDHLLTRQPALHGLYQLASSPISKYDLLVKLRDALGLATMIARDSDFVIDRSMVADRFRADTGYGVPNWDEMVAGLADDLRTYWDRGWNKRPLQAAFLAADSRQEAAS